jgi:hypothetical protein
MNLYLAAISSMAIGLLTTDNPRWMNTHAGSKKFNLRRNRMKIVGMMLLVVGTVAVASAATAPEIDAGSTVSALALLSGTLLMLKSHRKK